MVMCWYWRIFYSLPVIQSLVTRARTQVYELKPKLGIASVKFVAQQADLYPNEIDGSDLLLNKLSSLQHQGPVGLIALQPPQGLDMHEGNFKNVQC